MSAYLGFNVLSTRPDIGSRKYTILANTLDSKTGIRRVDDRSGVSAQTQSLRFLASSRAEVDTLRDFFAALRGRAVPFWLPSWRSDLILHATALAGATSARVTACGYSTNAYIYQHLRDVQIYRLSGITQWRRITSATDSGLGYETIGLSAALSSTITTADCVVSYLSLYRLGSDTITTEWHSSNVASIGVDISELPSEVPA